MRRMSLALCLLAPYDGRDSRALLGGCLMLGIGSLFFGLHQSVLVQGSQNTANISRLWLQIVLSISTLHWWLIITYLARKAAICERVGFGRATSEVEAVRHRS